jgi:5-methylcytosine-specific restriction endonuclease McrA
LKNKDRIKKYQLQYRLDNVECQKERSKKHYQQNCEQIRQKKKHYREDKHYEIKEYNKKYYNDDPERTKLRNVEYNKTSDGKASKSRRDHRRRINGAIVDNSLTSEEWFKILKFQDNKCACCGGIFTNDDPPTKDHIVPLILPNGGVGLGLTYENTQAVHRGCNSRKKNRLDKTKIVTWLFLCKPI